MNAARLPPYEQAMRDAGIPHGRPAYARDASIVELYGEVFGQCLGDPIDGILRGLERDLALVSSAMENESNPPLKETVVDMLNDMELRVGLARALHERVVDQLSKGQATAEETRA